MFLGLSQFGPAPVSSVGPVGPCWPQNDFGPSVVEWELSSLGSNEWFMQIVIDVTLNNLKYFSWKIGVQLMCLDLYYNVIKLEWLTDPLREFYHEVGLFWVFSRKFEDLNSFASMDSNLA